MEIARDGKIARGVIHSDWYKPKNVTSGRIIPKCELENYRKAIAPTKRDIASKEKELDYMTHIM